VSLQEDRRFCEELAERLVEAAKKAGAESCDATCGLGASLSVTARDGDVEKVTRSSSRGAGIRVIVDQKLGFATAAEAPRTEDAVRELAENAVALARVSTASEHNVIAAATPDDELEARLESLQLWVPSVPELPVDWAQDQALTMERLLRGLDGIDNVRDVGAGTGWGVFALATSTGFLGSYGGTSARVYASGIAEDEGGKKRTGSHWDVSRDPTELAAPEAIVKEAAERALRKLGSKKIPSAKVPVVFDREVAKGFFGSVLGAINGDVVARKASFLADKRGEKILPAGVTLADDPLVPRGFGSRPFDGEGLPVQALDLVDAEGVLRYFLLDARSASKLGLEPTGHASRGAISLPSPSSSNVVVSGPGGGDLEAIVKETARGLYVDSMLGQGPSLITGEYSRAASGFWIENGELTTPVEEVTVAGEMPDMMLAIDRVGDDHDTRTSLHAPTIRFAELAVSGS
jgi:PmbA protein